MHTNIVGEKSYTIKALYSKTEIWSKDITIKGVKPEAKVVNINISTEFSGLTINPITLKVKNLGDAPLYLDSISSHEFIKVYLDSQEIPAIGQEIVLPSEEKVVNFVLLSPPIPYKDLDKEHTLQIYVSGNRTDYTIPPAKVTLNTEKLMFGELWGVKYLDNMTVTITNGWVYPFYVNWIGIMAVDRQGFSTLEAVTWIPEKKSAIMPGETATYTLKFLIPPNTRAFSRVEFYLGETKIATSEITPS